MRFVKLAVISFIVLSLVIYALSLLIPSEMRVSRAVTINASRDSVWKALKNVPAWSSWNIMLQQSFTNITTDSTQFKADQLEVRVISATNDLIQTSWQQSGNEKINSAFSLTAAGADKTVLQWYFDFKVKWYPWEKFGSIIFDKQMGPGMEQSLNNFRKQLEAQ